MEYIILSGPGYRRLRKNDRPSIGWLKLDVDASYIAETGVASSEAVARIVGVRLCSLQVAWWLTAWMRRNQKFMHVISIESQLMTYIYTVGVSP